MLGGAAAQNIMYSCKGNPVQLTDNVDLDFAKENKASRTSSIQVNGIEILFR